MWDRLRVDQRHVTMFPPSFFSRGDETDDSEFYAFDRLVTHIDDGDIAAVGELYNKLGLCGPSSGPVLDICSSWISHFPTKPERLVITGMNKTELTANEMADEWLVKDINADPTLPFADASFTAVTCCVSVDYLHKPLDVFAEVQRILQPNGVFVCTFSNRCFPTKAIRGWLATDDVGRCRIVETYFDVTSGFDEPTTQLCNSGAPGDPLYAVSATRSITQT